MRITSALFSLEAIASSISSSFARIDSGVFGKAEPYTKRTVFLPAAMRSPRRNPSSRHHGSQYLSHPKARGVVLYIVRRPQCGETIQEDKKRAITPSSRRSDRCGIDKRKCVSFGQKYFWIISASDSGALLMATGAQFGVGAVGALIVLRRSATLLSIPLIARGILRPQQRKPFTIAEPKVRAFYTNKADQYLLIRGAFPTGNTFGATGHPCFWLAHSIRCRKFCEPPEYAWADFLLTATGSIPAERYDIMVIPVLGSKLCGRHPLGLITPEIGRVGALFRLYGPYRRSAGALTDPKVCCHDACASPRRLVAVGRNLAPIRHVASTFREKSFAPHFAAEPAGAGKHPPPR